MRAAAGFACDKMGDTFAKATVCKISAKRCGDLQGIKLEILDQDFVQEFKEAF